MGNGRRVTSLATFAGTLICVARRFELTCSLECSGALPLALQPSECSVRRILVCPDNGLDLVVWRVVLANV